ncbi:hypothetical protein ACIQNU_01520 [Streptomyces sp. NPDC091292]|uniref:hypothetical protein n=1 Tax=Streptomyces sp. NPDC091292 TaxID=3365991 RepID=UPI003801B8BD
MTVPDPGVTAEAGADVRVGAGTAVGAGAGDAPSEAPSDYRLLVPRDWFRLDLTEDRWRGQLKTFVDREFLRTRTPAETSRAIWSALRNTAESGVARGALEFFLRTEPAHGPDRPTVPASLLVSLKPLPRGLVPEPTDFAATLSERRGPESRIDVVRLPAGETVRVITATTLDFHIRMPGDAGYFLLAFTAPVSGTKSPLGDLCDAIAHSLRWV